ncbi:alpha/beta-hydrolase [Thozetella sp. PMI_491]|nr:alpha/beta-hydrolase [Thozetella sp. PMI_491]
MYISRQLVCASFALQLPRLLLGHHVSLASHTREYFYVGGHYVNLTINNTTSQYMAGQIYVEKLTPQKVSRDEPIVFIEGAGQTGTNFLNTPDGRPGWADYFLSQGFVVYLTDQPQRGRSPVLPVPYSVGLGTVNQTEWQFTAVQDFDLWPQAHLHTQWPGTGLFGDPVFEAFFASQVQFNTDKTQSEANNAAAYPELLRRLGQPVYLLTHSQSGPFGWRIGDAVPHLVKRIIALEPAGPPFADQFPFAPGRPRTWGLTNLEIAYEPPAGPNATDLQSVLVPAPPGEDLDDCWLQPPDAPKRLVNLSQVERVLVVTSESSYHAPYDYCTVAYLRQAGVNTDYLNLPKVGIHGNGHMMFMELNSLEIAAKILEWLDETF